MKAIATKMKMYGSNINVVNNNNIERSILNTLLWSFGMLAVLYILILGNMVSNIVQRRNLEADARTLGSEVKDLELSYLSMSSSVDLNLSYSMGFKEAKATFATRKSLGSIKMAQNDL